MIAIVLVLIAQTECARDFPTRCSADVTAGQKVPFDGQLLTPDMAIFLGQSTQACTRRIEIEVTKTTSIAKADAKRDAAFALADLHFAEKERDLYKRQADTWFWERPAFLVPVTVVLTAIATGWVLTEWEKVRKHSETAP